METPNLLNSTMETATFRDILNLFSKMTLPQPAADNPTPSGAYFFDNFYQPRLQLPFVGTGVWSSMFLPSNPASSQTTAPAQSNTKEKQILGENKAFGGIYKWFSSADSGVAPLFQKKNFRKRKCSDAGIGKFQKRKCSHSGETPRRSSRLSAKAKATETPEDEKPPKGERESSGKKGKSDKKDNEDGENKTPEAADESKESANVETKDAEDDTNKNAVKENGYSEKADQGAEEEKARQETQEKDDENIDKNTEDSNMLPEGKEKNAEKKAEDSDMQENVNAEQEKHESSATLHTKDSLPEGKEENLEKKAEDSDMYNEIKEYENREQENVVVTVYVGS